MTAGRIAILIDGAFFLKRLPHLVAPTRCDSPGKIVACIRHLCRNHVKALVGREDSRWQQHVYRIFFYDAAPYDGKAHHPIDNRIIEFAKSDVARHRLALFELLRQERKLALRLGNVVREHNWALPPSLTTQLLRSRRWVSALARLGDLPPSGADPTARTLELSPDEIRDLIALRDLWQGLDGGSVRLGLRQKGVDMRIGIDIASLTLKKQADTVVLVAGDSDFVPAAKLAPREGMEFILDPLWQQVSPDLFEHIDGLQSGLKRPGALAARAASGQALPGA